MYVITVVGNLTKRVRVLQMRTLKFTIYHDAIYHDADPQETIYRRQKAII